MEVRGTERRSDELVDADSVRRAQKTLVDEWTAARLAEFFNALADHTRVRIVSALSTGELCVGDLSAALGMSSSAISHQLRLLRQLHLVRRRREGQIVYYSVDDEHVSALFEQGTQHVRHG